MVGTVLSEYAGVEPYVSRSFGTWIRSGRRMLAVTVLMGSVALVGFASCGEAETEATPTPTATAVPTIAPPLVTAPARSPSPGPNSDRNSRANGNGPASPTASAGTDANSRLNVGSEP